MKEEMKGIPIQSGREVIQPFRVGTGPDGKPVVEAADHFIIRESDGRMTKVAGQLAIRAGFHLGPFDAEISRLVRNEDLGLPKNEGMRKRLCRKLESLLQSHSQLANLLSTPRGNVPVQLDDPDIRVKWHNYLFSGRELIDEIGCCLHICAGLDYRLKGLNREKLAALKNTIEQARRHGHDVPPKLVHIIEQEDLLLEFIDVRNAEKAGGTIQESPWINPNGVPSGGKISFKSGDGTQREFEMVSWLETSFRQMIKFAETLLG